MAALSPRGCRTCGATVGSGSSPSGVGVGVGVGSGVGVASTTGATIAS